jgi:DNA repair protein RadA/Sms
MLGIRKIQSKIREKDPTTYGVFSFFNCIPSREVLLLNERIDMLLLLWIFVLLCLDTSTSFLWNNPINVHFLSIRKPGITVTFSSWQLGANRRDADDDDDDDDEPPDVDVANFRASTASFGWNKGRSSPNTRKALGTSSSMAARVHICSNCGSEFVKFFGRCPTCKAWNTIQEHAVIRRKANSNKGGGRPIFGSTSTATTMNPRRHGSWLDDDGSSFGTFMGNSFDNNNNAPVRITDLTEDADHSNPNNVRSQKHRRILVPKDDELNLVLGGGIMKGSLILLGGDPGVGKSTLFLQAAAAVASLATPKVGIGMGPIPTDNQDVNISGPVWYVSGEENPAQIASRASRLGIAESELFLLRETHMDSLCEQIVAQSFPHSNYKQVEDDDNHSVIHRQIRPVTLLVIDSIQTMVCDAAGSSAAGGITQVRECVAMLLRLAKSMDLPILLIGHVTKSGDVAGPRTVEHMVDTVLYLDGFTDGGICNLRMLRASKNRFGSADEVGIYEMMSGRLLPVSDPSSLFLAHRSEQEDAEGCAIAIAVEGMRAMTVEVQALVTSAAGDGQSNYGGRRTVNGIAYSRLQLLLGVLQKRCGMFWSRRDVFVNVVGRMRLDRGEGNAADLAVAVALASSVHSIPVRSDTAFVGEVGLLGELRTVPSIEKRINEARRMGFSRVISPPDHRRNKSTKKTSQDITSSRINDMEWIQCKTLRSAINEGLVQPIPKRARRMQLNTKRDVESTLHPGSLDDLGLEEITDEPDDDDDSTFAFR